MLTKSQAQTLHKQFYKLSHIQHTSQNLKHTCYECSLTVRNSLTHLIQFYAHKIPSTHLTQAVLQSQTLQHTSCTNSFTSLHLYNLKHTPFSSVTFFSAAVRASARAFCSCSSLLCRSVVSCCNTTNDSIGVA